MHGTNLMDAPYQQAAGLLHPLEVMSGSSQSAGVFRQQPPGVHRAGAWDDWEADPTPTEYTWNGTGTWRRIDAGRGDIDVTGRIIGGCIETLRHLAGTPYADTSTLRGPDGDDPLIVFVEAAGDDAFTICRSLHGMRLNGFFDGAAAILVGRTTAPATPTLTQDDAVLDALGSLDIPVLADVECGHVPPLMTLVNGAAGHLTHGRAVPVLEMRFS